MERHTKNRRNDKYLSGVVSHFDNNSTQKTHAHDPLFPYSKPQYVSVVGRMQEFPNQVNPPVEGAKTQLPETGLVTELTEDTTNGGATSTPNDGSILHRTLKVRTKERTRLMEGIIQKAITSDTSPSMGKFEICKNQLTLQDFSAFYIRFYENTETHGRF